MTEQQTAGTPEPNPAKQARNRLVAVIQQQQAQITTLQNMVREIVVGAGLQSHPKFASLMTTADEKTPDTTTEQAKQPMATDDPTNVGGAPAAANTGVTPAAVTDVNNSNVAADSPVLDNLQDVTAPSPAPETHKHMDGDINAKAPNNDVMDPPGSTGWTTSAKEPTPEEKHERFMASVRLARLQIAAGIEAGEDLTVAQQIHDSATTLPEINASIETLGKVAAMQRQATPGQQHRHLVPQQRSAAAAPSFQQTPAISATAVSHREGDDEWGLGFSE